MNKKLIDTINREFNAPIFEHPDHFNIPGIKGTKECSKHGRFIGACEHCMKEEYEHKVRSLKHWRNKRNSDIIDIVSTIDGLK